MSDDEIQPKGGDGDESDAYRHEVDKEGMGGQSTGKNGHKTGDK